MIQATRLSGEIIYLNYLQIEYIELIPETKITMMNGDYYLEIGRASCRDRVF